MASAYEQLKRELSCCCDKASRIFALQHYLRSGHHVGLAHPLHLLAAGRVLGCFV